MPIVIDPNKQVTDPVLLSALAKQGINYHYVELYQDYALAYDGQGIRLKGRSPYAKFYHHTEVNKRWMVASQLPMVNANGIKVEVGWQKSGAKYNSKVNQFQAQVSGKTTTITCINDQPTGQKKGDSLTYTPHLYLNGIEVSCGKETLLAIDPTNANYQNNVLEWDYGICKRRLRLIEGKILGTWVFAQNPNGEVRIQYDQAGDFRLHLGQYAISDSEELIPAKTFDNPIFGYPFTISDSLTFYPDVHTETTSVDGYVRRTASESYGTKHDSTGTTASDSDAIMYVQIYISAIADPNFATLDRMVILLNTSALPDGAIISAATLSLYGADKGDNASPSWACTYNIYSSNPTSTTALATGDYLYTKFGTTIFCDTPIAIANWLTASPYWNDFALNAAGITAIKKTDADPITKFGVRDHYDATNTSPGYIGQQKYQYIGAYTAEQGNGYKPKLVVTYTFDTHIDTTCNLSLSPSVDRDFDSERDTSSNLSLTGTLSRALTFARATISNLSLAVSVIKGWGRKIITSAGLSVSTTVSRLIGWIKTTLSNLGLIPSILHTPVAITQEETNVTASAARINGKISQDGGASCEARFRWRNISDLGVDWTDLGNWDNEFVCGDYLGNGIAMIDNIDKHIWRLDSWVITGWQNTLVTNSTYYEDLTGLDAGTIYEFQTQAKNSVGEGNWSDSEYFWTTFVIGCNLALTGSLGRTFDSTRATSSSLALATSIVKSWGRGIITSCNLALSTTIGRLTEWARATISNFSLGTTIVATLVGIQNYLVELTTNLSLSPTITRTVTIARDISTNFSLAATVTKSWGRSIATSCTLVLSTTVGRVITRTRTITSNVTLASTIVKSWARAIATSVNLSLSTTVSKIITFTRTTTSTLSLAPSLSRLTEYIRTATSNLTLGVSVAKAKGWTIITSAGLTMATTISRLVEWARATSSGITLAVSLVVNQVINYLIELVANLSVSPTVSKTVTFARSLSSSLTLSPTIVRTWTHTVATSVSLTLASTVGRVLGFARSLTANLNMATSVSRVASWFRGTTSNLSLGVTLIRSRGRTIATSVGLSLSTSLSRLVGWVRTTTSNLNLGVSVITSAITPYLITITTNLSLAPSIIKSWGRTVATTTNLTLGTSVSRLLGWVRAVVSNLNLATTLSRIAGYPKTILVNLTLVTTIARIFKPIRALTTNLTLAVTITKLAGWIRTASSNLTLAVTVSKAQTFIRTISASLQLITQILSLPRIASYMFRDVKTFTGRVVKTFTGRTIRDDYDKFRDIK